MQCNKLRLTGDIAGVLFVVWLVTIVGTPVMAQIAFKGDGIVESSSGGLKFPDGTIQGTAAINPGAGPVEDTRQQQCYDPTGLTTDTVACAGTGQDGEKQAGVDWPAPRFTDNMDGTVSDNLT